VNHETHFKGWAKTGPVPQGLGALGANAPLQVEPHETLDALSGHFRLFQLREGHRFSTDDILTAWYGTSWCPTARTALDLGSGIGTVGMVCAWRLPGARFVTVEAQPESVALARKSARYNGLSDRYEIPGGRFSRGARERNPGRLNPTPTKNSRTRLSALLLKRFARRRAIRAHHRQPPYFPPDTGVKSEHPQLACRFELRGTVADCCATVAKHLLPGGFFACVFPNEAAQLARMESGARDAGLVIVRKRPVVFSEGEPPRSVALFGLMRADDLPDWFRGQTWEEPPLIIRTRDGKIHPEYSAVKLAIGFPP
jgi:tRNA1(Val) A37 N6-methylase TrmN6